MKGLYSNHQRCFPVAGEQSNTGPFVEVEKMEAFPATERVWKGLFVHYTIQQVISGTKCLTP
jgi:hypothetical protein